MIIHNPAITGSLGFPRTDGTKVVIRLSSEGGLETVILDATGSETGNIPASNFSGSFTGSFLGDGSQLTGVAASQLNIDLFPAGTIASDDQLLFSDTDDSGSEKRGTFVGGLNAINVISGSSQVDVEQTTNFTAFSSSIANTFAGLSSDFNDLENKPTLVSGSSQILFNGITDNAFSASGANVFVSSNIIPTNLNLDLGSPSAPFKDLYLSSASLYVDGTQVISSNTNELIITTDANQSLKLVETGADTVQIQTENGDITLTSSGTGNIELDAPIQIVAGNQIISSDGNAIQFGEDIDIDGDLNVQGNITLTGTVDGVDVLALSSSVAGLSTDYNDLINIPSGIVSSSAQVDALGFLQVNGDDVVSGSSQVSFTSISNKPTLVSGSSQVSFTSISNKPTLVSGSSQIDVQQTTNFNTFSSSIASTFAGLSSNYADLIGIPSGIVSGSTQILTLVSIDEDNMATNSDTKLPTQQSVKTYVDNKVSDLVDSAPGALDTLNELAAALGDDANFATTISTTIGGKVSQSLQIIAGNGLTGGGNLTTDRTLNVVGGTGVTVTADAVSIGQAVGTSDTVQFAKVGVGGASDATYELKVTGDIGATGDIVAYISSDERLKKNIELISNPIQKVQALKGVTWVWKDEASDAAKASPNLGVIAQDVEKVLPQLVHDRENGYKGVDYSKMVGLLIEAVKDQQKQIDDLKSRLS